MVADSAQETRSSAAAEQRAFDPGAPAEVVCRDMLGNWRLRKSVCLDDARWHFDHGELTDAANCVAAARYSHREILRILRYGKGRTPPSLQIATQETPAPSAPRVEPNARSLDGLAPREREFAVLLSRGKSVTEIAAAFSIKTTSAAVYHSVIAKKLGVVPKKLAAWAQRQGWGA